MSENRPKVGMGVVIIKDGKILIGKRTAELGLETWAPPGGHLEFNESFEECAKRETREEAGIEIKNVHFLGITNDNNISEDKHYITVFMKADYDSGEVRVREPDKCELWDWFDWEQIPSPRFVPLENLMRQGVHPLARYHGKLVRDKIPEIIERNGDVPQKHIASEPEYKQALQAKLIEKVDEYLKSEEPEELADILEVIHSLTALHKVNREQLQLLQKEKRDERGGFSEGVILEETR